jgi:hypothetical protein
MRIPLHVELRQDEIRRAAAVRDEAEQPLRDVSDLTIADDCAAMLEAWWSRRGNKPANVVLNQDFVSRAEIDALARSMRQLGKGPR